MSTIADALDPAVVNKLQQVFEVNVSQEVPDARVRDAKAPRKEQPQSGAKTHIWRGKPVTEKQFAHYARMSNEIPENSGAVAVFEVEEALEPKPQPEIDSQAALLLLLLLAQAQQG